MSSAKEILQKLSEPFAGDVVKWRAQGKPYKRGNAFYARVVAYVDARIVIDRLNEVMALDWQKKITETAKGRVVCSLGLTIDGREVWRDDGAGDTQIEGEKGAISDALKRAAVNFGIGAYLYALPSPSVEVECDENNGKVYLKGLTRESRQKLASLAQRSLDKWESDLKAMDAGDEEDAPQTSNASPPPPPPPAKARQESPQEPEQKQEAKKPAPKQEAKPAGGKRAAGVHFPAPDDRSGEGWKAWSRPLLARIKSESSAEAAFAHVSANEAELAESASDTGKDSRALLIDVMKRRWPDFDFPPAPSSSVRQDQPAEEAPAPAAIVIELPKTRTPKTMDAWACKVFDFIHANAETMKEAEEIIAANKHGLELASTHLKLDAEEMLRANVEEVFAPKAQTKKAPAR